MANYSNKLKSLIGNTFNSPSTARVLTGLIHQAFEAEFSTLYPLKFLRILQGCLFKLLGLKQHTCVPTDARSVFVSVFVFI